MTVTYEKLVITLQGEAQKARVIKRIAEIGADGVELETPAPYFDPTDYKQDDDISAESAKVQQIITAIWADLP